MKLFWLNTAVATGIPTLLCGLVAWGLLWPVDDSPIGTDDDAPVIQHSVDLVGRQQGIKRWRLLADRMSLQGNQQRFDRGARGWFYGDDKPTSPSASDPLFFRHESAIEWHANVAVFDAIADRLDLEQAVNVFSDDGTHLQTNHLQVISQDIVEVPTAFTLYGPEVSLTGQSGSFDFAFSTLTAQQGTMLVSSTEAVSRKTPSSHPTKDSGRLRHFQPNQHSQPSQHSQSGQNHETSNTQPNTDGDTHKPPESHSPQPIREDVSIAADRLVYNRDTEVADGEGNVEIVQGETTISAPKGTYKRQQARSELVGGVELQEPERWLSSERMQGDHTTKVYVFDGRVTYRQLGQPASAPTTSAIADLHRAATEVRSRQLTYESGSKTSKFSGDVEFLQQGRRATATTAQVIPTQIVLEGNVRLEQVDGRWLKRHATDADSQHLAEQPSIVYAERVEIDPDTNDAHFYDRVVVVQPHRVAAGETAVYREGDRLIELTGTHQPAQLCDRTGIDPALPTGPATEVLETLGTLSRDEALDTTCRGADRVVSHRINLDMTDNRVSTQGRSQLNFRMD